MVSYARSLVITGFALLIVSCSIVPAHAQIGTTGFILGTVTDATGAVIPGATVSVVDTSTNVKVSIQTDQFGNYFVQNLNIPGPYRVSVEATGFKGFVATESCLTSTRGCESTHSSPLAPLLTR